MRQRTWRLAIVLALLSVGMGQAAHSSSPTFRQNDNDLPTPEEWFEAWSELRADGYLNEGVAPPPLTDAEKRELLFWAALEQFEASVRECEFLLVSIDEHYRKSKLEDGRTLREVYVADGKQAETVLDKAVNDVRAVAAHYRALVEEAKNSGDLSPAGRAKLIDRLRVRAGAADAASSHVGNAISAAVQAQEFRIWYRKIGKKALFGGDLFTVIQALEGEAYWISLSGTNDKTGTFRKGHLTSLLENYQTWTTTAPALESKKNAIGIHNELLKVPQWFWKRVDDVQEGQAVVAVISLIGMASSVARGIGGITNTQALRNLFQNAGPRQYATLELGVAGGGGGLTRFGTLQLVGGGAAASKAELILVSDILGLTVIRAIPHIQAGQLAFAMTGGGLPGEPSNKGIPTRRWQPKDQDPNFPKNSIGNDYPDVKYPEGHPKAGQRMEFPGWDKVRARNFIKDPAKRVKWTKTELDAYKAEWKRITGTDNPPGGWGLYEIHHIRPRAWGGDNSFLNLIPVLKNVHRQNISPWWATVKADILP